MLDTPAFIMYIFNSPAVVAARLQVHNIIAITARRLDQKRIGGISTTCHFYNMIYACGHESVLLSTRNGKEQVRIGIFGLAIGILNEAHNNMMLLF